jgi:hypothetical protein
MSAMAGTPSTAGTPATARTPAIVPSHSRDASNGRNSEADCNRYVGKPDSSCIYCRQEHGGEAGNKQQWEMLEIEWSPTTHEFFFVETHEKTVTV